MYFAHPKKTPNDGWPASIDEAWIDPDAGVDPEIDGMPEAVEFGTDQMWWELLEVIACDVYRTNTWESIENADAELTWQMAPLTTWWPTEKGRLFEHSMLNENDHPVSPIISDPCHIGALTIEPKTVDEITANDGPQFLSECVKSDPPFQFTTMSALWLLENGLSHPAGPTNFVVDHWPELMAHIAEVHLVALKASWFYKYRDGVPRPHEVLRWVREGEVEAPEWWLELPLVEKLIELRGDLRLSSEDSSVVPTHPEDSQGHGFCAFSGAALLVGWFGIEKDSPQWDAVVRLAWNITFGRVWLGVHKRNSCERSAYGGWRVGQQYAASLGYDVPGLC